MRRRELVFTGGLRQVDELRQDFVAVLTVERQRQLRGKQAVFDADVVAAALKFAGKIAFASRRFRQRVGKVCAPGTLAPAHKLLQDIHHARCQCVHAEEAEVVAGAQTGNNEFLFGHGRRRFLEHTVHLVETGLAPTAP